MTNAKERREEIGTCSNGSASIGMSSRIGGGSYREDRGSRKGT